MVRFVMDWCARYNLAVLGGCSTAVGKGDMLIGWGYAARYQSYRSTKNHIFMAL